MNFFKSIARGMAIINALAQVAMALQLKQAPDFLPLSTELFNLITLDFKVKPGVATPLRISNVLDGVTHLFLA